MTLNSCFEFHIRQTVWKGYVYISSCIFFSTLKRRVMMTWGAATATINNSGGNDNDDDVNKLVVTFFGRPEIERTRINKQNRTNYDCLTARLIAAIKSARMRIPISGKTSKQLCQYLHWTTTATTTAATTTTNRCDNK